MKSNEERFRKKGSTIIDNPFTGSILKHYLGAEESSEYLAIVERVLFCGWAGKMLSAKNTCDAMVVLFGASGLGKDRFLEILFGVRENMIVDIDVATMIGGCSKRDQYIGNARVVKVSEFSANESQWDKIKYRISCKERSLKRYIFVGTSNNEFFIPEKVGSRRFLPVRINKMLDQRELEFTRTQILSQATHAVKDGVTAIMSPDEIQIAERYVNDRVSVSNVEGFVTEYVSDKDEVFQSMLVKEIHDVCICDDGNRALSVRVGKILRKLGWEKVTNSRRDGIKTNVWARTPRCEAKITNREVIK